MPEQMGAVPLLNFRIDLADDAFAQLRVWQVPEPVPGSAHHFKYSLAYVADEVCVVRFDNERGKGDHYHFAGQELPYRFTDLRTLQEDFWAAIDRWRERR